MSEPNTPFTSLLATRAPFVAAGLVPILVATARVTARGLETLPWLNLAIATLGAAALHVAASGFADYYDWKQGLARLERPETIWRVTLAATGVAFVCGAALMKLADPGVLAYGAIGLLSAYVYSAPPLRLVARKGLGELLVALNVGPLMTSGTAYALTRTFHWQDLLLGLPVGLLTTAILWVDEFPDASSDAEAGKTHLVAVLGRRAARWGYVALLVGAFGVVAAAVATGLFPTGALLFLGGLPVAVYASRVLFEHWNDRELVRVNKATIVLQALAGLLMAGGLYWNGALTGLLT